jgi:HEAT repeat protein
VTKKPFERIGNFLRFTQTVNGQNRGFEFYHEPFEGTIEENIELFGQMYRSGVPGRMQQGVNLLAQSKDEKAIPCLIEAVRDNKFTGRSIAAAGLANYPGSKKAMKALVGTFTSGDYMLTLTAIKGLAKLGMPKAKKPIRKVLARCLHREELFRREETSGAAAVLALACIASLIELGDDEQRPLLLRFLGHPMWEVKYHAAKVFAKFPDRNAETLLRRLLTDANSLVRLSAAEALIGMGDESCYEVIRELLRQDEPAVHAAAVAALIERKTKPALDILEQALGYEKDPGLELEIVSRLRENGRDTGLEELRAGLEHENPFIRQTAIKVAGSLGAQPELLLLREALASEPDEFLKSEIEKMLRKHGGVGESP